MIRRVFGQIRRSSHKVDPTRAFDFIPANASDSDDIIELCLNGFIRDEPHSKALNLTPQNSRGLFEYIVAKSLHYPYSYRIHEKRFPVNLRATSKRKRVIMGGLRDCVLKGSHPIASGQSRNGKLFLGIMKNEGLVVVIRLGISSAAPQLSHFCFTNLQADMNLYQSFTNSIENFLETGRLVGMRLLSIGHRDQALNIEPIPFTEPSDPGVKRLCEILVESQKNFWRLVDPSVTKVIRREITYVIPRHQRKGIANYIIHHGLDFEKLKKEGVHGISSEASSLANQTLLRKNGYEIISKPNYKLDMFDGNKGVTVFFKDFRN